MNVNQRLRARQLIVQLGLFCVYTLSGCGDNGGTPSGEFPAQSVPPTAMSAPADARQGRYVGTVTIGGVDYYGDALITADGFVRMYVGGAYVSDGTIQQSIPVGSAQLVGTTAHNTSDPNGDDLIFGQGCVLSNALWTCTVSHANPSLAVQSGNLQGEVDVTNTDTETWTLQLSPWIKDYNRPATQGALMGNYQEELADFSVGGDTIMNINAYGSISFQSPSSGCIGHGLLTPHLDGASNVYDVTLDISNCQPPYDYLNSTYEGLASTSPSATWDHDVLLRMWLSQPNPDIWDGVPPALTTLGRLQQ